MIHLRYSAFIAFLFFLCASLSCSQKSSTTASTDIRIVSLSPSTTETVFALGAGSKLVGRSRYCNYPSEASSIPVVGGFADPNMEAILALKPSLVIGARGPAGPSIEQALRARGIETYFPETESIEQIKTMIRTLGKRLNTEEKGEWVVHKIEDDISKAQQQSKTKPRVAFLFDAAPIVVAGPGSFPNELLTLAGATNVIQNGGIYPTIGIETLLALDPDVILDGFSTDPTNPLPSQQTAVGWKDLRAIKNHHVVGIAADTVLRPGPRIGEGLIALTKAIHEAHGAKP